MLWQLLIANSDAKADWAPNHLAPTAQQAIQLSFVAYSIAGPGVPSKCNIVVMLTALLKMAHTCCLLELYLIERAACDDKGLFQRAASVLNARGSACNVCRGE